MKGGECGDAGNKCHRNDDPEYHACRMKKQKEEGSKNSERRDYVWDMLQMTSI
jgi:hypothetical protein